MAAASIWGSLDQTAALVVEGSGAVLTFAVAKFILVLWITGEAVLPHVTRATSCYLTHATEFLRVMVPVAFKLALGETMLVSKSEPSIFSSLLTVFQGTLSFGLLTVLSLTFAGPEVPDDPSE